MNNPYFVPLVAAAATFVAPTLLAGPADEAFVTLPNEPCHRIPFLDAIEEPHAQTQSFFVRIGIYEFLNQYAFDLINLEQAHTYATGDDILVAVLDTGVSPDHDMFYGRLAHGYNFVHNNDVTSDEPDGVDNDGDGDIDEYVGHGTWVAGIIAATAPDVTILPVRVLDSDGVGTASGIASGIYYAVAEGADIINLSIATTTDYPAIEQAITYAYNSGTLIVSSVANNNSYTTVFPAAYPEAFAVTATDENDIKSTFSNYGMYINVSAPGTEVAGPLPDNEYGLGSGTSGAAAFVSGTAALLMENATTNDPLSFVAEVMMGSATNINHLNPDYAGLIGYGRLNAGYALQLASTVQFPSAHAQVARVQPGVIGIVSYLDKWFIADPTAELTGDASIDALDLVVFLDNWFNANP